MNKFHIGFALLAAGLSATPAAAVVSAQFSKVTFNAADANNGDAARISFIGVSEGLGGTRRDFTNIGGRVTYELKAVTHSLSGSTWTSSWQFLATIRNTSSLGGTLPSARISAVGFSTAAGNATGDNPAFLNIASRSFVGTPPVYDILAVSNTGLNLPNPAGSNNPQVCLKASGPANNCSGGGGDGLEMGTGAGLGTPANPFPATSSEFILNFTGPAQRTSITLHNFVLRFQSLTGTGEYDGGSGTLNGASGVGIVSGVEIIPEPSSWAMLIAGFGLIGTSLRRRRLLAV
ncbi:MAG: cistern family PEP-CTERM protein [Alphaproteobacteria bacterium]|nr:cistern family PEP-CTERM protein [Alphaproteobacteria bacterium]